MKEKTTQMTLNKSLNEDLGKLKKTLRVSSRENAIRELMRHSKEYLKLRRAADYNQLIAEDFNKSNQFVQQLKKMDDDWKSDINTIAINIQRRLEALEKKTLNRKV